MRSAPFACASSAGRADVVDAPKKLGLCTITHDAFLTLSRCAGEVGAAVGATGSSDDLDAHARAYVASTGAIERVHG